MRKSETRRIGLVVFWSVVGTLVAVGIVLVVVPLTGAVDVAATHPHLPIVGWFLETLQERSVAAHARDVEPPGDLGAPQRVTRGLVAYHEMCVVCHGAPGVEPSWVGQGLNPRAPALWEAGERDVGEAQAARDYRVVKHGIRMTAMPALAPSHGDDEIWDLVSFLQHLPQMSPEAYASAVRDEGLSLEAPGGHDHGEGPEEPPADEQDHDHGGHEHEEPDDAGHGSAGAP